MTDLEARTACKKVIELAATNLKEGRNALRAVRDFVSTLSLDDEAPAQARKFSGARDRMERAALNRDES